MSYPYYSQQPQMAYGQPQVVYGQPQVGYPQQAQVVYQQQPQVIYQQPAPVPTCVVGAPGPNGLVPQAPPATSMCPQLVVPNHTAQWGFRLRPRLFSLSGNDFTVKNHLGQDVVRIQGKLFSLSNKTMITGLSGGPIVEIKKKLFSLHNKHHLTDPRNGQIIATVKKRITFGYNEYQLYAGYENFSPGNLMFSMKGDIFGLNWTIVAPNGQCVARAVNPNALINDMLFQNRLLDEYFVDIAPGVDSLYVLALVLVAEEVHEEGQR
mmetsp:Transcript_13643/g.22266  ORF Transcript_13643/g.22266 Transcript_13643/m.22266 type:complete len:265 (-) Transcript_13643:2030-2824(-)